MAGRVCSVLAAASALLLALLLAAAHAEPEMKMPAGSSSGTDILEELYQAALAVRSVDQQPLLLLCCLFYAHSMLPYASCSWPDIWVPWVACAVQNTGQSRAPAGQSK